MTGSFEVMPFWQDNKMPIRNFLINCIRAAFKFCFSKSIEHAIIQRVRQKVLCSATLKIVFKLWR